VPDSAVKEQYQLRASFFNERLDTLGFIALAEKVKKFSKINSASLNWANRKLWGITDTAWATVATTKLDPILFFVHPNTLSVDPTLLRYYRCITLLPQKGLQRLSKCDPESAESGERGLTPPKIQTVTRTLNELMSFLLTLGGDVSEEKLKGAMYATAGVMIDGSWRNSIGAEGERVIRALLLRALISHAEVSSVTFDDDSTLRILGKNKKRVALLNKAQIDDVIKRTQEVRSVAITNGCIMVFKSEPDIELLNPGGKILGGIEIKAGLDPAAALERLGAMFKSFENILAVSPGAETILVASCLTDEVSSRIRESSSVKATFILTEITSKSAMSARFVNRVRSVMKLIPRRM